jgi:integrase
MGAPIKLQRALILALHSGQRRGDLLRLPWSDYNGSTIILRQSKARRHVRQDDSRPDRGHSN